MNILIRKAFKYRLVPSSEQVQLMSQFAGCGRFLWNKVLAMNLKRLQQKLPILWYQESAFWLTLWKSSDEYHFLKEAHSQVLQQKLKDLEKAFKDAFDKKQALKRIPIFKRRGKGDSFRYPQGFKVDEQKNQVYLPKIGWMKYYNSRKILGTAKNVTVSRHGKHWYISVQVEYETKIQAHPSDSIVGIDLGIKRFATLSTGEYVKPLNCFRKLSRKLAIAQRRLAKKVKFSQNWKKQQQKIAKIHQKIANARADFLHKLSSKLSKNHAMIVLEQLKVSNMSKSAKGNEEKHGKNVKAKSGLNKSILDQGWSMFVNMLEYKQNWRGGQILKIPPQHTSQRCNICGFVDKQNRKSQNLFECQECGHTENADYNAAKNILAAGHAVLACGALH